MQLNETEFFVLRDFLCGQFTASCHVGTKAYVMQSNKKIKIFCANSLLVLLCWELSALAPF